MTLCSGGFARANVLRVEFYSCFFGNEAVKSANTSSGFKTIDAASVPFVWAVLLVWDVTMLEFLFVETVMPSSNILVPARRDAEATDVRILRAPARLMRLDAPIEVVSAMASCALTLATRAFFSIVSTSSWNRSQKS